MRCRSTSGRVRAYLRQADCWWRLGNPTVSITLDTYSHAIPALQADAAALIAGLVFAGERAALTEARRM